MLYDTHTHKVQTKKNTVARKKDREKPFIRSFSSLHIENNLYEFVAICWNIFIFDSSGTSLVYSFCGSFSTRVSMDVFSLYIIGYVCILRC